MFFQNFAPLYLLFLLLGLLFFHLFTKRLLSQFEPITPTRVLPVPHSPDHLECSSEFSSPHLELLTDRGL